MESDQKSVQSHPMMTTQGSKPPCWSPSLLSFVATGFQHLQQDGGGLAASAGGAGKRGSLDGTFIKR